MNQKEISAKNGGMGDKIKKRRGREKERFKKIPPEIGGRAWQ